MAIWAVTKDPGGTAGVMPVVRSLRVSGNEIVLFANGKAVELLKKADERFVVCESTDEILKEFGKPEVLLTSMCSEGGIGRDLVEVLAGEASIVALQDYWGARLWTAWADSKYRPDFICVNDEVGRNIVLDAWPEFPHDCVKITGYPALDRYYGYDAAAVSIQVREKLGLKHLPVVLFGGQLKGTGEMLGELVAALNELGMPVCLIPRFHPRMKDNAPEEVSGCESALASFNREQIIADTSAFDTQSLIAASDVIVSGSSTILVEAATIRKQNISVLYPDCGMAEFVRETGGGIAESPIVSLGCSSKATNRNDLKILLQASFENKLDQREAQEKAFQLDGKNAERIANFVASLL